MFKGKFFCFKSIAHVVKFIESWEGQEGQQKAVADFINNNTFEVIGCTPKGGIRQIKRVWDGMMYFTELAEPLIDQCEIILFFEEVPASTVHSTDVFDQRLKNVIAYMTIREYTKAVEIINAQTPAAAAYMVMMISITCEIPDDAKNWLGAYLYNAAYTESKA